MYPNTFYRVSVKAYVTDQQGRVFVVKEHDKEGRGFWGLPGGGLDHGESPQECLRREIREELGIRDVAIDDISYTKSFYMSNKDAWLLWVVYRARISSKEYIYGDGVTDAAYINAQELASSTDMFEQAILEVDHAIKTFASQKF